MSEIPFFEAPSVGHRGSYLLLKRIYFLKATLCLGERCRTWFQVEDKDPHPKNWRPQLLICLSTHWSKELIDLRAMSMLNLAAQLKVILEIWVEAGFMVRSSATDRPHFQLLGVLFQQSYTDSLHYVLIYPLVCMSVHAKLMTAWPMKCVYIEYSLVGQWSLTWIQWWLNGRVYWLNKQHWDQYNPPLNRMGRCKGRTSHSITLGWRKYDDGRIDFPGREWYRLVNHYRCRLWISQHVNITYQPIDIARLWSTSKLRVKWNCVANVCWPPVRRIVRPLVCTLVRAELMAGFTSFTAYRETNNRRYSSIDANKAVGWVSQEWSNIDWSISIDQYYAYRPFACLHEINGRWTTQVYAQTETTNRLL